VPEYKYIGTYHTLFLYESIWNLLNMAALLYIGKRWGDRLKPGDIFLCYLIGYPVGRFFLEFLRLDASQIGGVNANQTFMAVVALAAVGLLIWRHRKQPDQTKQ
jgi:phosphatidylglycerol:prolipoprotein diacylglycerol transferase